MYSKELMKFLYEYQKEDFKAEELKTVEIKFKPPKRGKLAKVFIENLNKE